MMSEAEKGFFFDLTPDRVFEAIETAGLRCTGRCMALNSFENRVYDVELETQSGQLSRKIIKFYRPGRWTREQILEEHEFLMDLVDSEIPVIAPFCFPDGETLKVIPNLGIYYTIFPKVGGRAPDELSSEQLLRLGRLIGRIHNVGAQKRSVYRLELTPETYGQMNLEFLLRGNWIPLELRSEYQKRVEDICSLSKLLFEKSECHFQRIHGDCHLGNLLWNEQGPFFLDFDDFVMGPALQDLWLLIPGRDSESLFKRDCLLKGYQEMRQFDERTLRLIEPLRALRFIHYSAWLAKRWEDPAFPLAFPQFGTYSYWVSEMEDLKDQLQLLEKLV